MQKENADLSLSMAYKLHIFIYQEKSLPFPSKFYSEHYVKKNVFVH